MIAIIETLFSITETIIFVVMNLGEILAARRMGLLCQIKKSTVKDPPSLCISVPREELIGVIKLKRDRQRVIIHKSTKRERTWQCSYFSGRPDQENVFDKNFYSLQDALDDARSEGFSLRAVMLKTGVVLF